jgi:SDR family mycofactocin-dependent oxidoreductase
VVSGAGRGQGRAHCLRLAADGADVIALDVRGRVTDTWYPAATTEDLDETQRLVEEAGGRIIVRVADVRDPAAVQQAADDGAAEFGGIDIVVANAGIVTPAPAAQLSDESWQTMLDINLTGAWNTIKAALPSMLERGRGSIVIISSANGGIKAPPHHAHYSAELGPQGIRVNTVHPTAVATDMIHNEATYKMFAPHAATPSAADVEPFFRQFHSLPVPWVEPIDVSNAVAWLCSDEARYVTGVALPVDAGLSSR